MLTGSGEGCISKKTDGPWKASPESLAPAVPVVGRREDFPPRFLPLMVLIRLRKSEMLLYGRFEILLARTTVTFA